MPLRHQIQFHTTVYIVADQLQYLNMLRNARADGRPYDSLSFGQHLDMLGDSPLLAFAELGQKQHRLLDVF